MQVLASMSVHACIAWVSGLPDCLHVVWLILYCLQCFVLCLQGKDNQLSRLNGVHAALQDGVNNACCRAGSQPYKLTAYPDYEGYYKLYCTKSASRSSGAEQRQPSPQHDS